MQDYNNQINSGLSISMEQLLQGLVETNYLNNPFQRFHESIEDYPDFLDDIDDVDLVEYDNWERFKPFDPVEGTTVGETPVIPTEDNDMKL